LAVLSQEAVGKDGCRVGLEGGHGR
jgi:hypothetical protein